MANVMRIEPLNKENWKIQMGAILVKNDTWGYVTGEIVKPEFIEGNVKSGEELKKWVNADQKAKSDIILSICPSELKQIKDCKTSKDVWTKLTTIYQSKLPAKKGTLLKQLMLHRMENDEDFKITCKNFLTPWID